MNALAHLLPSGLAPLTLKAPHLRVRDALATDHASALRDAMLHELEFEREDLGGYTTQWCARVDATGRLVARSPGAAEPVIRYCALLRSAEFALCVQQLAGEPVAYVEPPKLMRMGRDDRIMLHEDTHKPHFRIAVILHLTKAWRRNFGGNLIVGTVSRVEKINTTRPCPIAFRRLILDRRSVLTPEFNSMTFVKIHPTLAHGVTALRVDVPRLSIACLFGIGTPRPPAHEDGAEFHYSGHVWAVR